MAARLKPRHQDDVRAKIKVSNILTRLTKHVDGDVEMSPTQVRAAEILLKKVLPDLASTEHKGNADDPIRHEHTHAVLPPTMSIEEWKAYVQARRK